MIEFLRKSKAHVFVSSLESELVISAEDHHHLSRVLRLKVGDQISAASNGSVSSYLISKVTRTETHIERVSEPLFSDEVEVNLVVPVFKLDRLEWGIAKSVEAGATKITIGTSEHCSQKIDGSKLSKVQTRFQSIIKNSAMQSRRSHLTQIEFTNDVFEHLDEKRLNFTICDPDGSGDVPLTPATILIGPEGGFSNSELLRAKEMNAGLWKLSSNILRAESAMFAAVMGVTSRKL